MKTTVHAINFVIDKKLVQFSEEKIIKLEKYYDKITTVDIFYKVEKTAEKENKIAEVKILIPGDEIMVKKQCKTFEEATEECIESLIRILVKKKEKLKS